MLLDLRYSIIDELAASRSPLTVVDLADRMRRRGFELGARPGKRVCDAMRADLGRGRIVRVGRGCYRLGTVADSTLRYMQHVARQVRAEAAGSELRTPGRYRRPPAPGEPRPSLPSGAQTHKG